MIILHTSDWHLGRSLYNRKRYEEFDAFLNWLLECITQHQVEVLLIAGDIFDTTTPSNRAQQQYYDFLLKIKQTGCRHVVIIAGNHDSPSFLQAPKALLKTLDIHVVSSAGNDLNDEVIELKNPNGYTELIVCAVPYLRDRDLRQSNANESIDDKEKNLLTGLKQHYADVYAIAQERQHHAQEKTKGSIPIVAMGHLFATGGKTQDGDGVRDLYVGSLAHASADIFPPVDYLALGHLHIPQRVQQNDTMRYCGSPIAMGFGEAKQQKQVCLVDVRSGSSSDTASLELFPQRTQISNIPVPRFQALEQVRGDWQKISSQIQTLPTRHDSDNVWLEIIYEGRELISDLSHRIEVELEKLSTQRKIEADVLRIKNRSIIDTQLDSKDTNETLETLEPLEVFQRRLNMEEISEEQNKKLTGAYCEILKELVEHDERAE